MAVSHFDFNTINSDRKAILQPLVDYIISKAENHEIVRLNFICTHNSRRSHLAQIWAQAAATYYGVEKVYSYSGGTEVTALFPQVAETLKDSGFVTTMIAKGDNPVYAIKSSANEHPVIAFSKQYDNNFNPADNFAAILTCTQADSGCPFITGAEKRISISYEDPKIYDGTPEQSVQYRQRSLEIAIEMFYIFSKIK